MRQSSDPRTISRAALGTCAQRRSARAAASLSRSSSTRARGDFFPRSPTTRRSALERVRLVAEAERAEALREADRLKDALLASVSHDLRTPLTTIKALAHESPRDGDDRAATIEQQADRLNRMVADLLDLSRLKRGELAGAAELNAAEDLVGAAIQQVPGRSRDASCARRSRGRARCSWAASTSSHALRILVNLLENAHKYSPRDAAGGHRALARGRNDRDLGGGSRPRRAGG